jgi:hypothetical protein
MFEKLRFYVRAQNVRNYTKLMEKAHESKNIPLIDLYTKKIVSNAEKAIELGKKFEGEEYEDIKNGLENLLQIYKEIYDKIDNLSNRKETISKIMGSKGDTIEKQAINDLEKMVTGSFTTLGKGTVTDRSAQLVIQSLEVLYRRLEEPSSLNLIYFELDGKNHIPSAASKTLEKYVDKEIDLKQAQEELKNTIQQYSETFKKIGISNLKVNYLPSKN